MKLARYTQGRLTDAEARTEVKTALFIHRRAIKRSGPGRVMRHR